MLQSAIIDTLEKKEKIEHLSTEVETIRKRQMEILQLKNTIKNKQLSG